MGRPTKKSKLKGSVAQKILNKKQKSQTLTDKNTNVISNSPTLQQQQQQPGNVIEINITGRPKKKPNIQGIVTQNIFSQQNTNETERRQQSPTVLLQQPNLISTHCRLNFNDVNDLTNNDNLFMDEGSVYAFACSIANRSTFKRTIIVDPYYTAAIFNPHIVYMSARDAIFGNVDNYDSIIIIIMFRDHFSWALYERGSPNIFFFDPLPFCSSDSSVNRLTSELTVRLQTAISDIAGDFSNIMPSVQPAPIDSFNIQTDGVNCGVHVCLMIESYLMNNGQMYLNNLNIIDERHRVLRHLSSLYADDNCEYVPRPISLPAIICPTPVHSLSLLSESFSSNLHVSSQLDPTSSPLAINPRRSSRIAAKKPVQSKGKRTAKINPFHKCLRSCFYQSNFGCAAISSKHYPEYYDSGNFGDKICPYCGALLLLSESFSKCCSHGRVKLDPWPLLPDVFANLHDADACYPGSKQFRKYPRALNSLLSFASLQVGEQEPIGHGPSVCLLNGEFSHCIGDLIPKENSPPRFLGLYFIDVDEAVKVRSETEIFRKFQFDETLVRTLHQQLILSHPIAKACLHMRDMYNMALAEHQAQGDNDVPQVRLSLLYERDVPNQFRDNSVHPRQVNLPTGDQMAGIYVSNNDEPPNRPGIHVTTKSGKIYNMGLFHPLTDPCTYPLLFPSGERGYSFFIPLNINANVTANDSNDDDEDDRNDNSETSNAARNYISCRQFYNYRLQFRGSLDTVHHIYNMGRLTQTYIIDASFKVDQQVAKFMAKKQENLRVIASEELINHISRGLNPGERLGKVVVAPSTYKGSRMFYRRKFFDAMALFRDKSQPKFFLTFTSDPGCIEFKRALRKGECASDAAPKITRIWIDKSKSIQRDVEIRNVFGKCIAFLESHENQKRGGDHSHKLITIENLPNSPESIDEYICAEIPKLPSLNDRSDWASHLRRLHHLVVTKQLHRCGEFCKVDGKCSKHFPRPFSNFTIIHENRPCIYKRRSPQDGGEIFMEKIRRGGNIGYFEFNNSHVVPYNPFVLLKYGCHHNVEWVYGNHNAKYVCKYPLKPGPYIYTRTVLENDTGIVDYNEFDIIFKANYRSSQEAFLRLHGYPIVRLSHSVQTLPVHLPNREPVFFEEGREISAFENTENRGKTKLTAFFDLCSSDREAREYSYVEISKHYWYKKGKWQKRLRKHDVISRIAPIPPRYKEEFALRLLLMHVVGPISFEDLRTVNEHIFPNFVAAAKVHGLMADEEIWRNTLIEGAQTLNPREMRSLFVQILLFGNVLDALKLFEEFVDDFYDNRNIININVRQSRINRALQIINFLLSQHQKCNKDFGLPDVSDISDATFNDNINDVENFYFPYCNVHTNDEQTDSTVDYVAEGNGFYSKLNNEQRRVIDMIESALETPLENVSANNLRLFILTGSGGTGKTFVYNTLIYRCISKGKYVLPTASTGIAATILFNGRTVHSAFCLGININSDSVPSVSAASKIALILNKAQLIIIDEVSMLHRYVLEAIDRLLRFIAPIDTLRSLPFGGKVVLLGGDWKQLLPVVPGGNIYDQSNACIKFSTLYNLFKNLQLSTNMRVSANEITFTEWLEAIGRGENFVSGTNDQILLLPGMQVPTLLELINFVFDNGTLLNYGSSAELCSRLLLAPLNNQVDRINEIILDMLPGTSKSYFSADSPVSDTIDYFDEHAAFHDVEHLNLFTPPGFPHHELKLKIKCVVVLLRNIDIRNGLCNGTRLIVDQLGTELLYCRILTGNAAQHNVRVALSRFVFEYRDDRPDGTRIHFRRLQFPVKMAFCMTINKSQGQTVSKVGVALETNAFSPGQIYVAFSRVRSAEAIRVWRTNSSNMIRNVVAKHVVK